VTSQQAYAIEGMTMLPGIDDRRQKNEVTYEPDATTMLNFAQANNMNFLSIWRSSATTAAAPAASTTTLAPASRRAPGISATYSNRSPARPFRQPEAGAPSAMLRKVLQLLNPAPATSVLTLRLCRRKEAFG
jgi:hypothetical protein